MNKDEKELQIMTVGEVSEFLKLSKITIYKLVKKGQLPGFRVGNSWRFRKDKIMKLVSEKPAESDN